MAKKYEDKRYLEYQEEFTKWQNILRHYHTDRFDRNYEQYTAIAKTSGTKSKISDPVAPELIERIVTRLFEKEPKFYAYAIGQNVPKEILNIISSIPSYYWNCPERVQSTGTMRSKLKVWGREFLVIGNLAVETYFNNESDTPDDRIIPIEDIIFNPAKTLKTADILYIKQYINKKDLERLKEKKLGDEVSGRFNSRIVNKVLEKHKEDKSPKEESSTASVNRTGGTFTTYTDDILLISRWEGKHCIRILDWEGIVEEFDNELLNEDPIDIAMDMEVPKQPYAFSCLDFVNGLVKAKDLILNQVIDYGAKALNPPLFVDPNIASINKRTLANAYKLGGVVFATKEQAAHQPMAPLPAVGFDLMNYIQMRAESAMQSGPYLSGTTHQISDKTKGTATGIKTLVEQASGIVQDKQLNIEESILEPMANKWLKYAGYLMGEDEIKYVFITGQSPKWVKVTKGLLTGKITLNDLFMAEILKEEEAAELAAELELQGKDPRTELVFDVDWIIKVEAGSMAEIDKANDLAAFDSTIQMAQSLGVPIDNKRAWIERAIKAGIKEPENLISNEMPQSPQAQQNPLEQQMQPPNMTPKPNSV